MYSGLLTYTPLLKTLWKIVNLKCDQFIFKTTQFTDEEFYQVDKPLSKILNMPLLNERAAIIAFVLFFVYEIFI